MQFFAAILNFVLGASLGAGVVSHGLCVNMLRLEQFYELLALSVMAEIPQKQWCPGLSEPPMVGQVA